MIYFLQFSTPLGNQNHQARFYCGYCADGKLPQRMAQHLNGTGAAMTRWAVEHGIGFDVVATCPGDRSVERKIKNQHNHARVIKKLLRQGDGAKLLQ